MKNTGTSTTNNISTVQLTTIDSNINFGTSATTGYDEWSNFPTLIKAVEVGETIEFIYKQTSNISYLGIYPQGSPRERVFKIVFSCKNGKWNKSEPIFGVIIPPSDEEYEFD